MASFFIGPIKLYSLSAQDVPGQMRKNQSLDGLGKSKHVWDFLLADQSHSNYGKSGYRREGFFSRLVLHVQVPGRVQAES